ncbi:MAG: hypothetical protein EOP07_17885 [Proteobacteria bacterium]|nr:MAG: hypothetical protein EOP07_17885 [Pseudomonadota bacterium]
MNDAVKSISLDDIGDLPNPIGMAGPGEKTKNKALHYNPQYGGDDMSSSPMMGGGSRPMENTQQREDKFSFSSAVTRFSEILGPISSGGNSRNSIIIAATLAFLAIAGGVYYFFGDMILGDGAASQDVASESIPESDSSAIPHPVEETKGPEAAKAGTETSVVAEIPGNPYWKLPNPVATLAEAPAAITAQQTETYRGGLAHPFSYQRYKSVTDMRKEKMDGSVSILYEALAQPKFWTRMEALLGIAEQGIPIDTDSMKAAVGDARSDLVRNYLRRFKTNYTDATAHVLRQALRVVDEKSRFLILNHLAMHRSEVNDMYLIAALNDGDAKTKGYAQEILSAQPVLASTQQAYEKAMSEVAVLVTTPKHGKAGQEIKVEKIPANMNVEEVYFINDEEAAPVEAPKEEVKVDDGFNDLNHSDSSSSEGSDFESDDKDDANHKNEAPAPESK